MDEQKLKIAYNIHTFYWKIIKEYSDITVLDEDRWQELADKLNAFILSIEDSSLQQYALSLSTKTVVFLEREARIAKK